MSVELADRLEISDFVGGYAIALDTRRWAAFECCFIPKATGDYGERLGDTTDGGRWWPSGRGALTGLDSNQHVVGTIVERALETRWMSGNLGVFAAAKARAALGR